MYGLDQKCCKKSFLHYLLFSGGVGKGEWEGNDLKSIALKTAWCRNINITSLGPLKPDQEPLGLVVIQFDCRAAT